MQISLIRSETEWSSMAEEWNHLLAESISNVPFLRHEYLQAWWQHRGGGEWPESELYIIAAHQEDGKLIGLAPLFRSKNHAGKQALLLLGSIEISDFLDLIVTNENLQPFTEALIQFLTSEASDDWEVINLYNLLEESPSRQALKMAAENHGLSFQEEKIQPAPLIMLPDSFEDYMGSLEKKNRHELRRKMRNAAGFFIPVRWYQVEDPDQLEEAFNSFTELMIEETDKKDFLTAKMKDQLFAIMIAAYQGGWLQMIFMDVGKEKAACYFNFDYDNRIWGYNSGLSMKHNKLSPGLVLMANLIEKAIEDGRQSVDLMRGDEEYKYRLGAKDRYIYHLEIQQKKA